MFILLSAVVDVAFGPYYFLEWMSRLVAVCGDPSLE